MSTKVLLVHNHYQRDGGEDEVFRREKQLLVDAGHTVVEYARRNQEIANYSTAQKIGLALRTTWAWDTYRELILVLRQEKPAVAHFHNTFPLISPAAYYACHKVGVPVVQTLHNYRLFCPSSSFFRGGTVCEECVEHTLLRSVRYGCYRQSRPATATVAAMLAVHRHRGTWHRMVDCHIVLTQFARQKSIQAGLPPDKIAVKPNFLTPDPGSGSHEGDYALFVGRLAPEKGLKQLLEAWAHLSHVPLWIAGDGPMRQELEAEAARLKLDSVIFLGATPRDQVLRHMKTARVLVFPSLSYETFGLAILEAQACGLPVVASRLGAMEELVVDGRTGLLFCPGDPEDLAAKMVWAWNHPGGMTAMGRAARAEFEAKYTAERNYQMLMAIYRGVLGRPAS